MSTSSDAPRPRARRRGWRVAGWLLLAGALVYAASFVVVLLAARQDQRRPADAIVILGAAQYNGRPSPVLQARLQHGLTLYREGLAPRLVVTGGVGVRDTESEATVGRRWLIARGVPPDAIILRPEGRSTMASISAVAAWLAEERLQRVLLVSDAFHMARLRLEARRTGLEAYTSPAPRSPIARRWRTELEYLAAEAVKVPVAWVVAMADRRQGGQAAGEPGGKKPSPE